MKKFSIIVAIDSENGIGKNGTLPWHLKDDLKRFKEITCNGGTNEGKKNVVVMGRKTWESIPEKYRPLPGRINLVLSRNDDLVLPKGVLRAESFEDAFKVIEAGSNKDIISDVFIIGGQKVFEQAIKHRECEKLYITHVFGSYSCDTFFPPFSDDFIPSVSSPEFYDGSMKCRFVVYNHV